MQWADYQVWNSNQFRINLERNRGFLSVVFGISQRNTSIFSFHYAFSVFHSGVRWLNFRLEFIRPVAELAFTSFWWPGYWERTRRGRFCIVQHRQQTRELRNYTLDLLDELAFLWHTRSCFSTWHDTRAQSPFDEKSNLPSSILTRNANLADHSSLRSAQECQLIRGLTWIFSGENWTLRLHHKYI